MDRVVFFTPYPFVVGQRVNITGGRRAGDWEVVGLTDRTVTLRCPISGKQFEWDRFCYLADEREAEWPATE
jgi:hypothetical protein